MALSDKHKYSLLARNNLAGSLDRAGDYENALVEYRAVIRLRRIALGEEHWYTINDIHSLAVYLVHDVWLDSVAATGSGDSADIEEAIELISIAIEIMERPHLKSRPATKQTGGHGGATFGSEAQTFRTLRAKWLVLSQHPHPESFFDRNQVLAAKLQVKSQRHKLVWFEPGTVVRIEGLKTVKAAFLNGTEATVKSFDYDKKRFAVLSDAAAKEIAILPECLALVRAPPECATAPVNRS